MNPRTPIRSVLIGIAAFSATSLAILAPAILVHAGLAAAAAFA